MSILSDLYSAGAETAATAAAPGTVTAAHARAAVRAADRLATAIHRDVTASSVRPAFRRYWGEFYNKWLAYRTLHADEQTQADPRRVLDVELPRFVKRLYEWRDALVADGGRVHAAARVGATGGVAEESRGIGWRPVLVLGGVIVGGMLIRAWMEERERALREETDRALAAERERAATLLAGQAAAPAAPHPYPYPQAAAPPVIINVPSPSSPRWS